MISYSTNIMGPYGMWWFRENGFTERATKVLEEDSPLTGKKAGDVVEYDRITEYWYGGRIDVGGLPTDEYYNGQGELGLPIMDGPSYARFSDWIVKFRTETLWTLDQLVEEFEKSNPKIRWHNG